LVSFELKNHDTIKNGIPFKLIEKHVDNYDARCVANKDCQKLCEDENGIFEINSDLKENYCIKFSVI